MGERIFPYIGGDLIGGNENDYLFLLAVDYMLNEHLQAEDGAEFEFNLSDKELKLNSP